MRLEDLISPCVDEVDGVTELDPMRLSLHRYLSVPPISTLDAERGRKPLLIATARSAPTLYDDLRAVGIHRTARSASWALLCLADSHRQLQIPAFLEACSEHRWHIERIAELSYIHVKIGILVRCDTEEDASEIYLHNSLVLNDFKMRILQMENQGLRDREPSIVKVYADENTEDQRALLGVKSNYNAMQDRIAQLEEDLFRARRSWQVAVWRLQRLQDSRTFLVGKTLTQVRRNPSNLLKLPVKLGRLARARNKVKIPDKHPLRPSSNYRRSPPLASRVGTNGRSIRELSPELRFEVPEPTTSCGPQRLRIATICRPSLADRIGTACDVSVVWPGAWTASGMANLPTVDLLIIDAGVGRSPTGWHGLGEPGEVPRTRDLLNVLSQADARGIPSVLLVPGSGIPAGLRPVSRHVSVVLDLGLGQNGWDPGVRLDHLRIPEAQDEQLRVHAFDPVAIVAPSTDLLDWHSAADPFGLEHWSIGATSRPLSVPFGASPTLSPLLLSKKLGEQSVVLVSSTDDNWIAATALAAGCSVVTRRSSSCLAQFPQYYEAPEPSRVAQVLREGVTSPSFDATLNVRRQLLVSGSSQERILRLAEILNLPVKQSLRAHLGLGLIAHIPDDGVGARFARAVTLQTRRPVEIAISTTADDSTPWVAELRALDVPLNICPPEFGVPRLVQTMRQASVAVWNPAADVTQTSLADAELGYSQPTETQSAAGNPFIVTNYHALLMGV